MDVLEVLNGTETLILVGAQDLLTPPEHSLQLLRQTKASPKSWSAPTAV